MIQAVICDMCQSEFEWTEGEILLDIQLQLRGSGLGKMCPVCAEKDLQISLRDERRHRRAERRQLKQDARWKGDKGELA